MDRDATLDLYVSELSTGRGLQARSRDARYNSTSRRKADVLVIAPAYEGTEALLSVNVVCRDGLQ
jgi:hypothetical protein